jgi:hypothetical protein
MSLNCVSNLSAETVVPSLTRTSRAVSLNRSPACGMFPSKTESTIISRPAASASCCGSP